MLSLTCSQILREKINNSKLISKYKVTPDKDYIDSSFEFNDKSTKMTIYNTNTITISGKYEKKIYQQLILASDEIDWVGCDEVGVGDFFGPTVYVSVMLTADSLEQLSKSYINIKDSKKISNNEILEICNHVCSFVDYRYQIIYDSQIDNNLNSIQQKLYYHHKNLFKAENKTIIDLFTTENSFYKYSQKLQLNWPQNLVLETKADSKFLCVALASIIARGIFLTEMAKIQKKYNKVHLKLGANVKTDAQKFVDVYGKEELAKFCKTSFKTFGELKG